MCSKSKVESLDYSLLIIVYRQYPIGSLTYFPSWSRYKFGYLSTKIHKKMRCQMPTCQTRIVRWERFALANQMAVGLSVYLLPRTVKRILQASCRESEINGCNGCISSIAGSTLQLFFFLFYLFPLKNRFLYARRTSSNSA